MISNGLVCLIGILTVFVGLVCLIFICGILSIVCKAVFKESPNDAQKAPTAVSSANAPIENKQEIVAGVCAVIAEELGTDVSNIKVTSFKRV